MDLKHFGVLSDALQNAESLVQNYNAQISNITQEPQLPSLTELSDMIKTPQTFFSDGTTLSGGKKGKYGASKRSKRKNTRSSRSKRADLRERYKLSPRRRVRRKTNKK